MKKFYYILGSLQAFTGIGAIPAGYGMLADTSGQGLGMSTELLGKSPLDSFLLPGLFLFLVNGLCNLAGAWLSFTRNRYAGYTGLILGILLVMWISVQVAWISLSSVLQPLYLVIGLINAWLAWRIIKTGEGKATADTVS